MSLPDPITIVAAAPTPQLVFARIKQDGYGSEMIDTGGNKYSIMINHTPGKTVNRHYVKITQSVDAVNPYNGFTSAQNANVSISISRPSFGYTDAAMVALVKALTDFLYDTEVTTAKLLQFQS